MNRMMSNMAFTTGLQTPVAVFSLPQGATEDFGKANDTSAAAECIKE